MSQFKITLLALLVLPVALFAQETKSKEITKHYNVSATGNLSIDGKYGDVHIETWDKNEVDLKVTIEISNRSATKAQQYLDKIKIVIDDSSPNDLSFKTIIDGNINNNNSNEKMEIEYRVKVPKTLNMELKNSYGHLYLQDADGKIGLNVAYGNFKVGSLNGPIDIKLSYGNGRVEKVTDGEIVVRYSNLDIEDAGNVEVSNSYSNIDFGTSKDVDLTNKYGNLTWKSVNSLDGYSKYGNVKVAKLYNHLNFEVMYGGGIKVDWVSKDFKVIDVESSYATVALKFQKGMSAMLDADLKYCSLKNYDIEFDHSFIDESGSQQIYRGKLGQGSFSSKINVVSEYGTVKMSYTDDD